MTRGLWPSGGLRFGWPVENPSKSSHFFADQILRGLRGNGARIDFREIRQVPGNVLVVTVADGSEAQRIAFDLDDLPEVVESIAEESLVYFKMQFARGGYPRANVLPGGFFVANMRAYRFLPLLRAMRARKMFRCDVYGRFGLLYGGAEVRKRAYELLSARTDFRFEGSLFRYPGGPDKLPYRKHLFEIPRAKVCVDMPGKGDLCPRLIDYLAVGACVVGPPPSNRLPVELVDGVHVVYCERDLSDLGDVCAQLVRDEEERERIAYNAREYFDRHLHQHELAAYYVREIGRALRSTHGTAEGRSVGVPRARRLYALARYRRPVRALACSLAVATFLAGIFVLAPEKLGDWPYNAVGRNTHHSPSEPRP